MVRNYGLPGGNPQPHQRLAVGMEPNSVQASQLKGDLQEAKSTEEH